MAPATATLRLARFAENHAPIIASWVADEKQLQWVSPGTEPPLTIDKVQRWPRPDGEAFVLLSEAEGGGPELLAYAELNRMRVGQGHWWIGHFIVHPGRRGQGLGGLFLQRLLAHAFDKLEAASVCLVVFPDNAAAIRCYESGGFAHVGNEYHRFATNRPRARLLRYEITRDTWQANQESKSPASSRG